MHVKNPEVVFVVNRADYVQFGALVYDIDIRLLTHNKAVLRVYRFIGRDAEHRNVDTRCFGDHLNIENLSQLNLPSIQTNAAWLTVVVPVFLKINSTWSSAAVRK